jgi:hypothetical protein
MTLERMSRESARDPDLNRGIEVRACDRKWCAVFTVPQNEKAVVRHLALREVESFLPTYETVRVWKNWQRVKTLLPLFPTYLFVHISSRERVRVYSLPGFCRLSATAESLCRFRTLKSIFSVPAWAGNRWNPIASW